MVRKFDDGKFILSIFFIKFYLLTKRGRLLASLSSLFIYHYILMKDKKELVIYIFIMLILFNY